MNEFIIISILAVGVVIAIYVKSLKLQKQCYKLENLSINKILRQSNTYRGRTIAIKPAEIDAGDGGTIKSYSIIMNLKQKCEVSLFDRLKYIFSLYYGNNGTVRNSRAADIVQPYNFMEEQGMGEPTMDNLFQKKVRAAAIAGWWTLLVAVAFHLFVTGGFAFLMHAKPTWVTCMWGGLSWDEIQHVGLYMIATYRVMVWLLLLVVVWLTLWARQLAKK